jgi:hypothetical protein
MSEGGFLSRWSRRKVQVREGQVVEAEAPLAATVEAPAVVAPPPPVAVAPQPVEPAKPAEPPPTLDDVARLTPQSSDFSRFVAPDVEPRVRNAALKKLFADPHFNVMDGLDTYIDDYGKPDPIPESMLRQMVQTKFLRIFDDEEKDEAKHEDQHEESAQVASAAPIPDAPQAALPDAHNPAPHEDADLRLQSNDAAGPTGPGDGAGPRAG